MEESLKKKIYILIAVLLFVGICIAVVIATSNSARKVSRDAIRISQMKELKLGMEMYFNMKGTYALQAASGACVSGATVAQCDDAFIAQYVALSTLNDPSLATLPCYAGVQGNCNYSFGLSPDKEKYEFCFQLESGIPGSELSQAGLYAITQAGWQAGCTLVPQQ